MGADDLLIRLCSRLRLGAEVERHATVLTDRVYEYGIAKNSGLAIAGVREERCSV